MQQPAPDRRDEQGQASQGEVAALRAQLRDKDKLLTVLMARASHPEQVAPDDGVREDPTERAVTLLDQRLFGGILSGPEVRRIESAARVATSELPNTLKSTITCSTELCRVTIEGAETELAQHCGDVLEHLPKAFAGGLVLADGDGRRAVFAATRREFLATADPSLQK